MILNWRDARGKIFLADLLIMLMWCDLYVLTDGRAILDDDDDDDEQLGYRLVLSQY